MTAHDLLVGRLARRLALAAAVIVAIRRSRHSAEHVASLVERLQLLAEQFRGNAQRG